MEDVDKLLLQSLSLLGWESSSDVWGVGGLSGSDVVSAVVRCVWALSPEAKAAFPSHNLPPNMTARFRLTADLAQHIQGLGYRGELGAQTLLYGTAAQLRSLLLFLVERLPKEPPAAAAAAAAAAADEAAWVQDAGRAQLRARLAQPWLPHYCHNLQLTWDGRLWHPPEEGSVRFNTRTRSWRHFPAAVIESSADSTLLHLEKEEESLRRALANSRQPSRKGRSKPTIAPKPLLNHKLENDDFHAPEKSQASVQEDRDKEKLNDLLTERSQVEVDTSELLRAIAAHRSAQAQSEDAMRSATQSQQSESRELAQAQRLTAALENPTEALATLHTRLVEGEERMSQLERRWEEASAPIQSQIEELRAQLGTNEAEKYRLEADSLRSRCIDMVEEADAKQQLLEQLKRELSRSSGGGLNREAYTNRILEIVASVQKQRREIDKVVSERESLEADVNRLSGRLERTMTAADALLFGPAKTDDALRRVFKLVHALHERCAASLRHIHDIGATNRETQELQDSLDRDEAKGAEEGLERMVTDLCAVQAENHELAAKIAALGQG